MNCENQLLWLNLILHAILHAIGWPNNAYVINIVISLMWHNGIDTCLLDAIGLYYLMKQITLSLMCRLITHIWVAAWGCVSPSRWLFASVNSQCGQQSIVDVVKINC